MSNPITLEQAAANTLMLLQEIKAHNEDIEYSLADVQLLVRPEFSETLRLALNSYFHSLAMLRTVVECQTKLAQSAL